jgi:hypothetical protein
MAKLDRPFCVRAFEVRSALEEGRLADAKRIAAAHLRSGEELSQEFRGIVAGMIDAKPAKRAVGLKRKVYPPHWVGIGNDFEELRAEKVSINQAEKRLAKKYGYSVTSIRTALRCYAKGLKAGA